MKKRFAVIIAAGLFLFLPLISSAQIGKRFPSERKVVKDPVTGTMLTFLTSAPTGDSKIYQTHNQWTSDGQWLIYRSGRARGEAMAVNEKTGEMVQVTEGGYTGMLNVARHSMKLYFMRNPNRNQARSQTGAASNATANMRREPASLQIIEVDLAKVFADSAAGKMQSADVYQRVCGATPPEIQALDANETWAYFRVGRDEVAIAIMGHRQIPGSTLKVAAGTDVGGANPGQDAAWGKSGTREKPTGLGIVNLRTREMTIAGQTKSGSGLWHVSGSADGRFAVGDDFVRNIYLIDRRTGEMILLSAGHKTTAADHPHPTMNADGTKIQIQSAMLSNDGKSMNICIIPVPETWLKRKY